jgi:hypothetical protein
MPDQEWIKTLADCRKVKFTYQEMLVVGACDGASERVT